MIGTTVEAIVLSWEAVGRDLTPNYSGLKSRIEALTGVGVHVFVVSTEAVAEIDDHLRARPRGPGTLHLCDTNGKELVAVTGDAVRSVFDLALTPYDTKEHDRVVQKDPLVAMPIRASTADALQWGGSFLAQRGISGRLILIIKGTDAIDCAKDRLESPILTDTFPRAIVVSVGQETAGVTDEVEPLGGALVQVFGLLDDQLARRVDRRVPQIDRDPTWNISISNDPAKERVAESIGALCNGSAGTRGSWETIGPESKPLFVVSGVYDEDNHRLAGPLWTEFDSVDAAVSHTGERTLDLRGGTLFRSGDDATGICSLRFVSITSPQLMGLRAEGPESLVVPGDPLRAPLPRAAFESNRRAELFGAITGQQGKSIAVAARNQVVAVDCLRVVERLAAWSTDPSDPSDPTMLNDASTRLTEVTAQGFDSLLAEHRQAWAGLWSDAEVTIDGDPAAQLAARFAVFHLLSAAADTGETGVGARGLTGTGYAGHVFWDADVFVLPVLAAIRPPAARAMIEYRLRRLPAARAEALSLGRRGARFPWESAGDGSDVTPHEAVDKNGASVAIATGPHEEHIVADVAWAAAHYAAWTGDAKFLVGNGRPLLVETARYWASRIETDADGTGHIRGVVGPDEYHTNVDDNVFTNVMARWNLRQGAALLSQSGDNDEATKMLELAAHIVDGWNVQSGIYEQFSGYFALEPLLMTKVGVPPIAADMLLGAKRVANSQIIKQADVLMAHHLVPEELMQGSLQACLDFYEPRTAHGSSLSPAISASLLARAGEPDRALALFRLAARLDLDDITGTTADGLHLATMGGVWQALAFGFLGMAAKRGILVIRPNLPQQWDALALRLRFAGYPIGVRAEPDHVSVSCVVPLRVRVAGQEPTLCPPGTTLIELANSPTTKLTT